MQSHLGFIMRVPKQRNTKFYSCTQTPIRYFTAKYEILQLHSNGHSFSYSKMQNFETLPKRPFHFFTTKHKILKTAPKQPFAFLTTKYRILKVVHKRPFVFPAREYEIQLFFHQFSFVS